MALIAQEVIHRVGPIDAASRYVPIPKAAAAPAKRRVDAALHLCAELVGGTGLHRIDWTLRKFEIGYWRKTGCEGRGYLTEAVRALARLAFDQLDARRVEIRMDDNNERSWRVAERAGFTLEALLRFDSATTAGEPRSTRVYARVRGAEEPMGVVRE